MEEQKEVFTKSGSNSLKRIFWKMLIMTSIGMVFLWSMDFEVLKGSWGFAILVFVIAYGFFGLISYADKLPKDDIDQIKKGGNS